MTWKVHETWKVNEGVAETAITAKSYLRTLTASKTGNVCGPFIVFVLANVLAAKPATGVSTQIFLHA